MEHLLCCPAVLRHAPLDSNELDLLSHSAQGGAFASARRQAQQRDSCALRLPLLAAAEPTEIPVRDS